MAQFVEAIPHLLLRIFAPALGVTLAVWAIMLFVPFVRKQVRPVFSVSEGHGRRVPPVQWVVLLSVMAACTLFSGKNTNGVQNAGTGTTGVSPVAMVVPGSASSTGGTPVVPVITPQDVSNGWRVAEETEAESFAQPSASAITNELWRRRGAFDDALRIPANGWSYPYASGITVLSRGELRTCICAHDFPRAFAQDISLLPLVSLSLLPEGRRESVFWYDTTSSNTLLTTWWNAALGRDATNPVNFQAELYPDGGFTYRYEDRTVHHARVWPFDWDNDGLENTVDPDPLTPGPDAHGTNAEWYNTVCSNLFSAVEGGGTGTTGILPVDDVSVLPWREGVNSNAYYFVDVVAEMGPAPIYFIGDRESRLGNPVVVANAFETNRVPLLIGIDYAITSPVPFAVSFPIDYMYPEVATNDVADYNVHWPLNFVFTEGIGASNRVYTVTVEPYDPGGVLEWDVNAPMRGGSGGDCDCVHCSGYSALFSCSSTCTCSGGCRARGRYLFEVAGFPLTGGECRCGFDDPPDDIPPDPPGTNAPPSLTITFSKPAVIFEDAFQEKPGMAKPRRSTRVRLTVYACGGSGGGALTLSGTNMDKLVAVDGGVPLPYYDSLAEGETFYATGVYEGAEGSSGEGDVVVQGDIVPNYPFIPPSDDASLTSVKVALEAEFTARDNPCQSRHTYGVGERVKFNVTPALSAIKLRALKADTTDDATPYDTFGSDSYFHGVSDADASQMRTYICPATGTRPDITVTLAGTEYRPVMTIVEPSEVVSPTASGSWDVGFSNVGFGHLSVVNYIAPFHVSFRGVGFAEIPCEEAVAPTGYFATNYTGHLTHTFHAGAGNVSVIGNGNYWRHDDAGSDSAIMNWSSGTLVWKVPIGWVRFQSENNPQDWALECDYEHYRDASSRPLLVGGRTDAYTQTFSIDSSGTTTLEKFGWRMTRSRWSFSGSVEKIE